VLLAPLVACRHEDRVAGRSRFTLSTIALGLDVVEAPSIDEARAALGGRASTERGAGELVSVSLKRGGDAAGVVVYALGDQRDVWIGAGRFVRTTVDRLSSLRDAQAELKDIAADARRFASLREGDPVRAMRRDGSAIDGRLLEKCRYGALVAHDDKIVAVSFRRVAPAPS
jgi:hypothetical protein